MQHTNNSTKKRIILFFLMFFVYNSFSQSPIFKHYTTKDGLPHDITYGLIQDSDGVIWIGTDDGLTRYDGITFKNYGYEDGLKSNYVIDILEFEKKKFAIATWGGGLHYFKNDSIFKPTIPNDENTKITILEKLKGNVIYSNSNLGFILYRNNTSQHYLVKKNESGFFLCNDKDFNCKEKIIENDNSVVQKNLYFHAAQKSNTGINTSNLKGVYELDNEKLVPTFTYLNEKEVYTIHKNGEFFYFGLSNSIIIGSKTALAEKIELPLIDNHKIISIKRNKSNLYFIALNSLNSKRILYQYSTESKKIISISNLLNIDKMISDFIFDNNDNLWITTYGKGVYLYYNTENVFLGQESFSNVNFRSGFSLNKSIFLLATNAIYCLDSDNDVIKVKKFPFETEAFLFNEKENTMHVFSFFDFKKKNINATKEFGVNIHFSRYNESSMFYENEEYCAFYKDFILSIYKKGKLQKKIKCDFLIKKIFIKNNMLYIFSFGKKLLVNDLTITDTIIKNYENEKIKDVKINDFIITDNNKLFLATDRGLFIINKQEVDHYTISNGLISNHINSLVIDKHGVLWLGTQRGLNVMYKDVFYIVGTTQGQKSSFITKVFIHNNYVCATGNEGLFKYNNIKPFQPQQLPALKVTQNGNEFTLFPIHLTNGKSLKIEYKIDNRKWIETKNTLLNFDNLSQGKHQIIFRYKNNLSSWSATKPYLFTVFYPWYLQSWFYALIFMFVSITITLIVYKLLRRSIKKNKELKLIIEEREKLKKTLTTTRKNLAQDFHDELGNKLASITMLINLLMIKNPEKNDNYNKFKKIKEDSNYLYSGMKDFIWSLNNESDNLDEVLLYLIEFGKNLFTNTEMEFYVESELQNTHITLPYYWSKQLIFIFKEAMTNTLKHSKATMVLFSFNIINNELIITLKDNGEGFKEKEVDRLNGILNMKDRAKKIKCTLTIKSNNKKTIVTFKGNLISQVN